MQRMMIYFAVIISIIAAAGRVQAQSSPVAADGAVSVNIQWEQGKSSVWYIELQRQGAIEMMQGMQAENDTLIRQGITIANWGFAHQGTNGSFTGTSDAFHSTSLFVEAVANAVIVLLKYRPVSYSPDIPYYDGVITNYINHLHAAANWLNEPTIAAQGQQGDQPYTHRRYLLAAALGQVGFLTQDSALMSSATVYAQRGMALEMMSGTENVPYPDGTTHVVSMAGVDPELGGYDVSYQCAGIVFAQHYYDVCTNTTVQSQLRSMMGSTMTWESGRIGSTGTLDTVGSTRIGIEKNRDGSIKVPDTQEIISALADSNNYDGLKLGWAAAYRYAYYDHAVTSDTVAADGAVDENANWEAGTSSTWDIDKQSIGGDYVELGTACENDAMIREGLLILNWGIAHQLSNGTFGTTVEPYYGGAQFIEGLERAALLLQSYHPVSYTADTQYYVELAAQYTQASSGFCTWLTSSQVWPTAAKSCAPYSSKQYALAAALTATAYGANNLALIPDADQAAQGAMNLQLPSGADPENGNVDANDQAFGLFYADKYVIYSSAVNAAIARNIHAWDSVSNQAATAVNRGLEWESQFISPSGAVTGVSNPWTLTMDQALEYGSEATGNPLFMVDRYRLNIVEMELYQPNTV